MWARNRQLTILLTANYVFAATASAFFHDHGEHGEDQPRPVVSASHPGDCHDCPVCQFLAQKPAPAAPIALEDSGALVQEAAAPTPVRAIGVVFSAWHSRAPPASA